MTTTEESSLLEPPREPDLKAVITKERLDSLKKAREAKAKKVKELNDKELDLVNTLKNIYNTMGILDTRVNSLDLHVRSLGKRPHEGEEEIIQPTNKKTKVEDEPIEEPTSDSIATTLFRGAGLAAAFIIARLASDYIDKWQSPQNHKDSNHDVHIPAFM